MREPSRTPAMRVARAMIALAGSGALVATACSSQTEAAAPPPPVPVPGPLAFPGAVGHGAGSKGGRGGRVMIVDRLADNGPGTLRDCIEADGPRTCVFRVAGVIRFETASIIRSPFLTIAGQTAPGGGITLSHAGGPAGRTPLVIKGTHDIVVRHIRVRSDRIGGSRGSEDGITVEKSDNVILDHVSASWARDELFNGYGDNDRITVSNSLFAQGMPKHDKCALLASDPVNAQRFSFIGNLCAHNGDRNPDIKFPPGSCAEVVNNVFYNAESQFTEIWENFGSTPVSIVGNSYIGGPDTPERAVGIARNTVGSLGKAEVYLWDNRFVGDFVHVGPEMAEVIVDRPPCSLTIRPQPAARAYDAVLSGAGAFPRDSFDTEMVQQTQSRSGRIIHQPGQIPHIAAGTPYPDRDRDGMDDRWETRHGASVGRADPWSDADRDGLANLDEFLDERHRQVMAGRP